MEQGENILTSVIVAAYNYGQYVAQAVESALHQDDAGVEVIVVNDGSTDETGTIAQSYVPAGIRYIGQANGGLSNARNTGLAAARGRYVLFLDADDALLPSAIRTLRTTLESLPGDYGVVGCRYTIVDRVGQPVGEAPVITVKHFAEVTLQHMIVRSHFSPTVLARREAFERAGGFDETLRASEDRDMWIRVAAAGFRIHLISDSLFLKREHGSNMSADPVRQLGAVRQVFGKTWRRGIASRWNVPLWGRAWAIYHHQGSSMYWDRRQRWPAWRHLLLSFLCWPVFIQPAWNGHQPFFRLRRVAAWLRKLGREWET